MDKRKDVYKKIEKHLRNYKTYRAGLLNLQKQLDYIMPSMTASYDLANGTTGTFNIKSDTENYAIDRIESRRALVLHESISEYKLIINSIDEALEQLGSLEKQFVKVRYFDGHTIENTAYRLSRSEKSIFRMRNDVMDRLSISLKGLLQF